MYAHIWNVCITVHCNESSTFLTGMYIYIPYIQCRCLNSFSLIYSVVDCSHYCAALITVIPIPRVNIYIPRAWNVYIYIYIYMYVYIVSDNESDNERD